MESTLTVESVKRFLIETLSLNMKPEELADDQPLFGREAGLGLDSIDAFEVATALRTTWGVEVKPDETDELRTAASLTAYLARKLDHAHA